MMNMRAISQVIASLILVMVSLGAVGIYFSVVQPLVSSPRGGIVLSITKEPEIEISGGQYWVVVELRAFNPLTQPVVVTKGEAIFLLNGPSNPVLITMGCNPPSRDGISINPGSVVHVRFGCSSIVFNNEMAFCMAYYGTSQCTITPRVVSDVMKNAILMSFVVYYTTTSRAEDIARPSPG